MDWTKLIADLCGTGMTQPQIATAIGCSQASVSEMANGITKNPKYSIGAALISLHKRVMRRERSKATA